ncbi:MAG: hypothetical protein OES47_15300 [Acidobacteriota bacterium]|nr:hypothetical protein [Acidobacteriota bacterium]
MCDTNKRSTRSKTQSGRKGATLPNCCGPMIERMMKTFSEAAKNFSTGSETQDSETSTAASCASAMERMASLCCDHRPTEDTEDTVVK